MQPEERYDNLSGLFAAQDEALQSEIFVEQVMKPIRKRAKWRNPLLFGAGGLGIGAGLSQLGGLLELLKSLVPNVDVSITPQISTGLGLTSADPILVASVIIVTVFCAAIVATERA